MHSLPAYYIKKLLLITVISIAIFGTSCTRNEKRILVFSKTAGFRHESIKEGKLALLKLGQENGIKVDTTENSGYFTDESLRNYSAVVFLNTTGDVLNYAQQVAFERYIQSGGGFVGIHSATDTEYGWPWFAKMVGGNFESHPQPQKATIRVLDKNHPATKMLPEEWIRTDEWYNFKNLNPEVKVLAVLDEKTYQGGKHPENHPLIWYHEYDGGRAFYTECGHTKESYTEELFLKHVLGGIEYAIGNNNRNYKNAKTASLPEENRFIKEVIKEELNEPMALDVSPDGRVFFVERRGDIYCYYPKVGTTRKIGHLEVDDFAGNGIMGMTLDPEFADNQFMYIFYLDKNDNYNLSRFKVNKEQLITGSEKVVFSFPFDHEPGAHNGGTIAFDSNKNLLISVGDNTPPWQANGYPPLDEKPSRIIYDAQRTAANTHDLRGKILRIKPKPDGTYEIPEGNLFSKDGSNGKAEIYAMGCRNPWRMSIDPKTNYVYWGEVGPDAGRDSTIGPRGYDEINQAKSPGNFGWPYFIADNKPYKKVDHGTGEVLQTFDITKPIENNSPNNTGAKVLPTPTKAFIYYPYAESPEFPEVGKGGRTACAGPIYYFKNYKNSKVKFPKYYDGKFFIFEWMRDWIMSVTVDKDGNFVKMEPALSHLRFDHPTFMKFGPDGALYVLEYGFIWYAQNQNARLSRVVYHEGNRPPVIDVAISDTIGQPPFNVKFDATKTYDPDNNTVSITWHLGKEIKEGLKAEFTFETPGIYYPVVHAVDAKGASSEKRIKIIVGNTYPIVNINFNSLNRTFFWPGSKINYEVKVTDKEDKNINPSDIRVIYDYLPEGNDVFPLQTGHGLAPKEKSMTDHPLIAKSDCKACHTIDKKSVGPSFEAIATKYKNEAGATEKLAKKIITGGSGVWGEHAMSAHPQISIADAKEMVNFIFSCVSDKNDRVTREIPHKGEIEIGTSGKGSYYISASYTDKGFNGKGFLTNTDIVMLRNARISAIDRDSSYRTTAITSKNEGGQQYFYEGGIQHNSFLKFKNIDLTNISQISLSANAKKAKGVIEVRIDSKNGSLLTSVPINPSGKWENWIETSGNVIPTKGLHNLYFIFKCFDETAQGENGMMNLQSIYFIKKLQ